jgi:uracil phosphoribosyltransferase
MTCVLENERIGEIMAYELSKDLHYKAVEIQT